MERLQFKTIINAPRERVWETLWGKDTYPEWTAAFTPGGSMQSDWKKGGRVVFLDANGEGMVSEVAELVPFEFVSFKHLGILKDGEAYSDDAKFEGWYGALENYTLRTVEGKTEVIIDQDLVEDSVSHFVDTWSKALQDLKEISETRMGEAAVGENIQARGLN